MPVTRWAPGLMAVAPEQRCLRCCISSKADALTSEMVSISSATTRAHLGLGGQAVHVHRAVPHVMMRCGSSMRGYAPRGVT